MASTELIQPEHVLSAPASYLLDGITESQNCHMMARWMTLKVKAAVAKFILVDPTQLITASRFQKDMLR